MKIEKISLLDYRNIKSEEIIFGDKLNIISGPNGHGKTNILESICLCSTGRSHRTRFDRELIRFGSREAHIAAILERDGKKDRIDVHIHGSGKKGFAVDSVPIKKYGDLFGVLLTVLFSPEEMRLVKNSPLYRRRFMDMELCQLSKIYYYNLRQYYKVLKQRNAFLKQTDVMNPDAGLFEVWDSQLAEYGGKIIEMRRSFIKVISSYAREFHEKLSGGKTLEIKYIPNTDANSLAERLSRDLKKDILLGSTQSGPHKDDLTFEINGRDVRIFGSQGEQRTAALCAKLSEIRLIEERTGTKPVILLDDVFSELDGQRKAFLLDILKDVQVIITAAEMPEVDGECRVIKVFEGKISN